MAEMHAYSKVPEMLKESLLSIDKMSSHLVTDTQLRQFEQKQIAFNLNLEEKMNQQFKSYIEKVSATIKSTKVLYTLMSQLYSNLSANSSLPQVESRKGKESGVSRQAKFADSYGSSERDTILGILVRLELLEQENRKKNS